MMNNKYGYFKYTDVAVGAKEDTISVSIYNSTPQYGSSVEQMYNGVSPKTFSSFEFGEYDTRNPKRLYKGQESLGYISSEISDENGYFETPINFFASFNDYYSMRGITIGSRNVISELEIIAYRDGEEISRDSFVAESKEQFYPIEIESANAIDIYIKRVSEAHHFLGIFNIEYGEIRKFEQKDLEKAEITNHFSVFGDKLEYDFLDLGVVSEEDTNYLFQKKQPIEYILNDSIKNRFFVGEGQQSNQVTTNISCYDSIYNLEEDFFGGIYKRYSAKTLIEEILSGQQIVYEIDERVANILLSGYLPITSRRKALQSVLLGGNIRCYKGDKLYFKPFDNELNELVLDESNIVENPKKTANQEIGSVIFRKHNYSKSSEKVEAYHWFISGWQNRTITFSQPLHNLKAYEVIGEDENGQDILDENESKNVQFVEKHPNYCIVFNTSPNKIVIVGSKYVDSVEEFEKKRDFIQKNGGYDIKIFESTISTEAQPVCDFLFDLSKRKTSIKFLTFENLEIGGYYNILGENLNVSRITNYLNGMYEVEAM